MSARFVSSTGATRTDIVLEAVQRELEARRSHLDSAGDVGEVTITVKLNAGTTWVRGVVYHEERVYRSSRP